jgi:recombination protein RecA
MERSHAEAMIARLREEIRRREASPSLNGAGSLASGHAALDGLLPGGGFPAGRVTELYGTRASGKTTLALMALAKAMTGGGLVSFVDPAHELFPPAAQALGADLKRLLIVRPEQASLALRAAALLARSGAFLAVAVDLAPVAPGLKPSVLTKATTSRRLLEAAQTGRAAVILLSEEPSGLDATLRVRVERRSESQLTLTLERSRLGASGRSATLSLPILDPRARLIGRGLAVVREG